MNAEQTKSLCLALMQANSEEEVVKVLTDAGFWDDQKVWRDYGDDENNFSTIGNQQSRPDAALTEKIVNSVDAKLMNECMVRGINPEGPDAPVSIRAAVAKFFDSENSNSSLAGRITGWSNTKRTDVARGITFSASGKMPKEGKPSFTISDNGEGQTPEAMPSTLLSIRAKNKLRIPFVQGKFNMGGTGVLKFCGKKNLELVVSRRNPSILKGKFAHASDDLWGFTLVRREDPAGGRRSSVYTYLAPVGADEKPNKGGVLRFRAETMPIFPENRNPYGKSSSWGTLIKLYEYASSGYSSSNILRKDGVLSRIDLLLMEPALPVRFHECRLDYGGHEGSFETTLSGLAVRLEDDKGENLEAGFPASCPFSTDGEPMVATIYAFRKGKAETYRKNEGIIFTVNGQTHGNITKEFFNRKNAGRLSYIADSIFVTVDCSGISGRVREDLFMNSRDRLSHGEIRHHLEDQLEDILKNHQGLRDLKERRRNEEITTKLGDEKPLEDILKNLLEHSPTLSALFLQGKRAVNPFKTIMVRQSEKAFVGKKHPTYFKFKGKDYGFQLHRDCHINYRARITFETDAQNDYFSRSADGGRFALYLVGETAKTPVSDFVGPSLQNGLATLAVHLPQNSVVGDVLTFEAVVTDPTLLDPFRNTFSIAVKPEAMPKPGPVSPRPKPPSDEAGEDREMPSGISLPNIVEVEEATWGDRNPPFDKNTALRIMITDAPSEPIPGQNGDAETHDVYDFLINMDNVFLKSELKPTGDEVEVLKARWKYGLVLVGLALLHDDVQSRKARKPDDAEDAEDAVDSIASQVERFTKALAPILLPMINSLGSLDLEGAIAMTASGEDT
jgi:hypothetical protein